MKCTAKAKATGQQCRRDAMRGQRVCQMHGGATGAARRAGARRVAEGKATAALQRQGAKPIGNPLEALQELAAEVVTLKDFLGGRVEVLQELRYRGLGGEEVRGELVAYERALDRSIRVLSEIARLNIDERLAVITAQQAQQMAGMITLFWRRIAGDGDMEVEELRWTFNEYMALLLRAVVVGKSGEWEPGPAPTPGEDLASRLDVIRQRLTAPSRTRALEQELARSRAEVEALAKQRDELLDALRRHASGPPLAIEPAPVAVSVADVVAGNVPVDAEPVEAVVVEEPRAGHPLAFSASVYVGDGYDD